MLIRVTTTSVFDFPKAKAKEPTNIFRKASLSKPANPSHVEGNLSDSKAILMCAAVLFVKSKQQLVVAGVECPQRFLPLYNALH